LKTIRDILKDYGVEPANNLDQKDAVYKFNEYRLETPSWDKKTKINILLAPMADYIASNASSIASDIAEGYITRGANFLISNLSYLLDNNAEKLKIILEDKDPEIRRIGKMINFELFEYLDSPTSNNVTNKDIYSSALETIMDKYKVSYSTINDETRREIEIKLMDRRYTQGQIDLEFFTDSEKGAARLTAYRQYVTQHPEEAMGAFLVSAALAEYNMVLAAKGENTSFAALDLSITADRVSKDSKLTENLDFEKLKEDAKKRGREKAAEEIRKMGK
ncbi:MAG: hypothetical protein V1647_04720, partial [Pseudomonadota bacterium]